MTDTYEKVYTTIQETDNKELNKLIIQYECTRLVVEWPLIKCGWIEKDNDEKYLYWVNEMRDDDNKEVSQVHYVKNELEQPFGKINSKIEQLDRKTKEQEDMLSLVINHNLTKFQESKKRRDEFRIDILEKLKEQEQVEPLLNELKHFEEEMERKLIEMDEMVEEDTKYIIQQVKERMKNDK